LNRIIPHSEQDSIGQKKQDPAVADFTEKVKRVADFDFRIKRAQLNEQAPFIGYCLLLLVVIIFHTHRTEVIIRELDKTKKEAKELRTEYISTLCMLMSVSKQSVIADSLSKTGIKELKSPPYKITFSNGSH
jgi:hypothetical protein